MTLLVASALLALAAAGWVVLPLLGRREAVIGDAGDADRLDAEARRRVALSSLREVEYDRLAGKLDDADYRELRGRLEQEALRAVRAADQGGQAGATDASIAEPPPAVDQEALHRCGFTNPAGSRFCGGCGVPLAA